MIIQLHLLSYNHPATITQLTITQLRSLSKDCPVKSPSYDHPATITHNCHLAPVNLSIYTKSIHKEKFLGAVWRTTDSLIWHRNTVTLGADRALKKIQRRVSIARIVGHIFISASLIPPVELPSFVDPSVHWDENATGNCHLTCASY